MAVVGSGKAEGSDSLRAEGRTGTGGSCLPEEVRLCSPVQTSIPVGCVSLSQSRPDTAGLRRVTPRFAEISN